MDQLLIYIFNNPYLIFNISYITFHIYICNLIKLEECFFKKGQYVIKQNDDGEVLYVVDKGELDCFKKFTKDADDTYLKTYVPGESFGELALLYNCPRAASIVAKEDSTLFSLDRENDREKCYLK